MSALVFGPNAISIQDAIEVLGAHGYRATAPRRVVVESVLSKTRPFTAEQLVLEMPEIGRATVIARSKSSPRSMC